MWEHSTNEWPDLFKKPMSWGEEEVGKYDSTLVGENQVLLDNWRNLNTD